jgi:hypothetical protein
MQVITYNDLTSHRQTDNSSDAMIYLPEKPTRLGDPWQSEKARAA